MRLKSSSGRKEVDVVVVVFETWIDMCWHRNLVVYLAIVVVTLVIDCCYNYSIAYCLAGHIHMTAESVVVAAAGRLDYVMAPVLGSRGRHLTDFPT